MGGEVVSLAAQVAPYASAAVGAYGGAVLAEAQQAHETSNDRGRSEACHDIVSGRYFHAAEQV